MVICKGTIGAGGFAFSPNLVQQQTQSEPQDISQISLSNEERVYQFRMSSSPLARNLASLLASAPVINLPVVRLIQKNFLPQSEKIVHVIAEVFLGGILKPTKVITPDTHPDYVEYRFIDEEIRDIFLQDSLGMTSLKIINKISEYIAEKLGKNRQEFQALLKNPQELEKLKNEKNLQNLNFNYFATITAKVLKRLGGDHALFANEIEHSLLNHNNNQAFFQEFAGNYIWAVKENGIWKEQLEGLLITRYLLISPQGEVQFGSPLDVVTIQNLSVKGQTLSWTFDDNESAASITFKINSENNYFWEQHQTGKLFEGSLEYPNQGGKDFRGRFEVVIFPSLSEFTFKVKTISILPTFDFEVATIELKKPRFNIGKPQLNIKRQPQQADYWPEKLGDNLTLEMVSIPGDTFIMGSLPEELEHQENESPQHSVTVQPFFMGKYQVTQAQWRFVAQLPQVNRDLEQDPSRFKGDNRPVEQVSWEDAVEFCDRLSQYTGRTYRLPSEAEWEYACRAGTTTPFHFGETITTDLANYDGNSTYGNGVKGVYRKETTEVGSFGVANNFGLYDMHGNVWEWCQDNWHSNYEGAPTDGNAWLDNEESSDRKLLRGGSWLNNARHCRSAFRDRLSRDIRFYFYGFRVVCSGAART
jgi:formylglycine-generating enzyme required for sulfatase activity